MASIAGRMKITSCRFSAPVAFALLFTLSGCDEPVPCDSFRLIAEDVTPDQGCTTLGDQIELSFPTNVFQFPGYRCSGWDYVASRWMLGCCARTDTYSLSENVTIEMKDSLEAGTLFLNYSDTPSCYDALEVIHFENL
jgi:hypothetical protein